MDSVVDKTIAEITSRQVFPDRFDEVSVVDCHRVGSQLDGCGEHLCTQALS